MHKELAAKIEEQLERKLYPGVSLALYKEGQWQEYYAGFANPDKGLATQAGLVYDLASVSKVLGVGSLLEKCLVEGLLGLEDPIQEVLQEFAHAHLRVVDLVTHTSGLDPFIPNRDQLNQDELKEAMLHLSLREDQGFLYSDVNFILLGFFLETLLGQSLDQLIAEWVTGPLGMRQTSFGPRPHAVPTIQGQETGVVHDPKARVLKEHTGSAGLFSTVEDLKAYLEHQLSSTSPFLDQILGEGTENPRSLAWRREGNWLDHTGYTGTFLLFNRKNQEAAIFLSNRTYWRDDRAQWICDRNEVMDLIRQGKM